MEITWEEDNKDLCFEKIEDTLNRINNKAASNKAFILKINVNNLAWLKEHITNAKFMTNSPVLNGTVDVLILQKNENDEILNDWTLR